ncbi:PIG-L family deacetylase [Candidatus Woesearchaeota archaeon]|nr:PIG-L family deacetylase [Candidatus Woesearchaeota archaeon]
MILLQRINDQYEQTETACLDDLVLPPLDLLVTGAHQDDEAFTFFYQLEGIRKGKKVGTVIATDGVGMNVTDSEVSMTKDEIRAMRNSESIKAAKEVGIDFLLLLNCPSSYLKNTTTFHEFKRAMEIVFNKVQPTEILTHSPYDDHSTHLLVAEAVVTAAKATAYKNVRGYPVWGSLLGRELGFEPQEPLYITPKLMQRQVAIFRACYPSQNLANDYPTALKARGTFQRIMLNAHEAARTRGYIEFFVDYTPITSGIFKADFKLYAALLERLYWVDKLREQEGKHRLTREEKIALANSFSL